MGDGAPLSGLKTTWVWSWSLLSIADVKNACSSVSVPPYGIVLQHGATFSLRGNKIAYLCLPPTFTPVSYLAYSSTLKMKATCFSETSAYFQRNNRLYILEDVIHNNYRYENLKSIIIHRLPYHSQSAFEINGSCVSYIVEGALLSISEIRSLFQVRSFGRFA
jgi:hypothetical protein